MSEQLDHGSRFQFTDTVLLQTSDGLTVESYGPWRPPSFIRTRPSADKIGRTQVSPGRAGKPDMLSYDIYGTDALDWVLVAFNGAFDVLNWPSAGSVIEYPLPSLVFAEVD